MITPPCTVPSRLVSFCAVMCDSDNRVSEVGRDDGVLDIPTPPERLTCVAADYPGGCPQVRIDRLKRVPILVLSLARRWPR
jgi:hypothetical protein